MDLGETITFEEAPQEIKAGTTVDFGGVQNKVEDNQKFYTGRGKKFDDLMQTKGDYLFFSKDPDVASWYGGDKTNVTESSFDTSKFLDLSSQEKKAQFVKENITDADIEQIYKSVLKHERDRDTFGKKTDEVLMKKYRERLEKDAFSGSNDVQKFILNKAKELGYKGVTLLDSFFGENDMSYVVLDKSILKDVQDKVETTQEGIETTESVETTPVEVVPKVNDKVTLPPQREGGMERTMVYTENGWKQEVGGKQVEVSTKVQEEAQNTFNNDTQNKQGVVKSYRDIKDLDVFVENNFTSIVSRLKLANKLKVVC